MSRALSFGNTARAMTTVRFITTGRSVLAGKDGGRAMGRVSRNSILLYAIFAGVSLQAIAVDSPDTARQPRAAVGGTIDNDAVWEGTIAVETPVSVNAGVRLTIRPGARILFSDGAGLNVAGALLARGTPGNPIRFMSAGRTPGKGSWKGIALSGTGEGSALIRCVVTNAEGVRVLAGAHEIAGCDIEDGATGISVAKGAFARIAGSTISGMAGVGVDCLGQAAPIVDNNIIRNCGTFGVNAERDARPRVTNNTISGCDVGISYGSPAPSPEGNRLENNRVGVGVSEVGGEMSVSRNRFVGNVTGLWVERFSSPRIEGNVFDNNGVGIFCYASSSPGLVRNRIIRNRRGIICQQLSEPEIVANELAGNETGVFLTFSSYAVMNGNNFDNNAVQIELGVMSHDWEVKVGGKPERGETARRRGQRQRLGTPASESAPSSDTAIGTGIVDATGNWWGDRDTAEMNAKGADANIGSLIDGRDVPPQPSEGYEGVFARDRIDYSRWKTKRIPDAGLSPADGAAAPPAGSRPRETGEIVWHADYRKAAALAADLGRPLFLFFTGSDWCDRCQLLKTEVFDAPGFADWARRSVILVEVDFPRTIRQDERLQKQNKGLAKRFSDFLKDGYPTVILLDPTGARILGELGYRDGDPEAWTAAADRLILRAR